MSDLFDRAVSKLLGIEGGDSDHPADAGGVTRWGITEWLARQHGYIGPMSALPLSVAKSIYAREYWIPMNLEEVAKVSEPIAFELFESAVNINPAQAAWWLQRCLNVFNRQTKLYADIEEDSRIGNQTMYALRSYLNMRGSREGLHVMLKALNALQGAYYIERSVKRPLNEEFTFGWFANRVG